MQMHNESNIGKPRPFKDQKQTLELASAQMIWITSVFAV